MYVYFIIKSDISNGSIEQKCHGCCCGAWSLINAEKIKDLFSWNWRGNDQSIERFRSGEASCGESDPKAEQACSSVKHWNE